MRLKKRTYSLPTDTLSRFEDCVKPGTRSGVVAKLMQEWLQEHENQALRTEIVAGCEDMRDEYLRIEEEFHPLDEEVHHRALDE